MTINEILQEAIIAHKRGNIQEAERLYRSILKIQSNHPDANHNLGLLAVYVNKTKDALNLFKIAILENPKIEQYWISYIDTLIKEKKFNEARNYLQEGKDKHLSEMKYNILKKKLSKEIDNLSLPKEEIDTFLNYFNEGKYDEAEKIAMSLCALFPKNIFCKKLLGSVFQKKGNLKDLLSTHKKIADLDPQDFDNFNDLAVTLQKLGRLQESEINFRKAIAINQSFKIAYCNLANLLSDLNRLDESEKIFSEVLSSNPNLPDAYNNYGMLLNKIGKKEDSRKQYELAIKLNPKFHEAYNNLANISKDYGDIEKAINLYKKAIDLNPKYPEAFNNLALTLINMERYNEALEFCRKAIELKPDLIEAYNNLGLALMNLNRLKEAEENYKIAIQLDSNNIVSHNNLGIVQRDLGRIEEAKSTYKKALKINPKSVETLNNLGMSYKDLGDYKKAEESYRKAINLDPSSIKVYSNLLFLQSSHSCDPRIHIKEALRYGEVLSKNLGSPFSEWICEKNPKRLRIGFVSGDLRNHPVGYFTEHLLNELQSSSVELYAYTTQPLEDDLTARIKPFFSSWKKLANKSDRVAANLIHSDGIHILIDLSGHTNKNRLPVFALKPAPIQVSWLGYWATTGVKQMDYILGDSFVMPNIEAKHFTEKIWQLPGSFLCLTEPLNHTDVAPLPALENNFITFGCFNNVAKMTDEVIALRAKVLKAVPNSKLFLKSKELVEDTRRKNIIERFKKNGIPHDRLIMEKSSPRDEYFKSYNQVDIALSPYPYGGTTTSFDGLWMGVPVLVKKGDNFLSNIGESITNNAGLGDWMANNDKEYISKAAEFSSDINTLAELRKNLRKQVLSSPLFDSPRFADNFKNALWGMWEGQEEKIPKKISNFENPTEENLTRLLNYFENQRYDDAEKLALSITQEYSEHPFAWEILGLTFKQKGRMEEAISSYQKVLELNPQDFDVQCNLADTLRSMGRHNEAEIYYKQAIKLNPKFHKAYNNLGNTLRDLNKNEEAEEIYKKAIKLNPQGIEAYNNLGMLLREIGKIQESSTVYQMAIKIGTKEVDIYNNFAITLKNLGKLEEAENIYKKALKLNPNAIGIYNNLGITLKNRGKLDEAINYFKRAIEMEPKFSAAYNNLGATLKASGNFIEAEKCVKKAIDFDPNFLGAYSNLLFLQSSQSCDPKIHIKEALRYGEVLSKNLGSPFSEWICEKNPKRLRIGFVSGDFNDHPVGHYLENLLNQLQSSSVELYAYSTQILEDNLTDRIKPFFSSWKKLANKSDRVAADLIHSDGIHILIDLSGHTDKNRLPVFALKPAPIQVSWLGYWATTGVKQIDYIIGDPYRTPKKNSSHFTEKIWKLPETSLCFTEPSTHINVAPLPALENNFITFGCFNSIAKMTDEVIALRAKVLKAVPNSKLFLKSKRLIENARRKNIIERFNKNGIPHDRLIMESSSPRDEYFKCYNRVDIALSPFPYGGVTTSTEGLWMGVPVLAKKGDLFISRVSESITNNAGLGDWMANSDKEYISKAAEFSSDINTLAELRKNLRKQVLSSPLFDSPRFADNFKNALWGMWDEWKKKS